MKIDTKKKAYELIHDPTRLLCLLYSKYGKITEDYYLILMDQIILERPSHLNIVYKELNLFNTNEEFLKRYYFNSESKIRVPKLSDYYENYHKFFCKPFFKNFSLLNIMKNYNEQKAKLFYKKNFDANDLQSELSDKCINSNLSTLDNITNNTVIFNKKYKRLIDDSKNYTITLTLNSLINIKNDNFINSSSLNNSIELIVKNLANYQSKKIKQIKENTNKYKNNFIICKKIQKSDKLNEILQKKKKVKDKNYSINKNLINNLFKKQNHLSNSNNYKMKNKIKLSPKLSCCRDSKRSALHKIGIIKKNFYPYKVRGMIKYTKSNPQIQKIFIPNNSHNKNHSLTIMKNNIICNSEIINNLKSMNLNYLHTVNNNINERKKNKTFGSNFYNPKLKNIQNLKYSHLNKNLSDKLSESKIKLLKNLGNNSIKRNQNKQQSLYHYYQNTLNQIMTNNLAKMKKNNTIYILNNISGLSPKINSISPKTVNMKFNNNKINKKLKIKLFKNQINNFIINFDKVFFNSSKTTSNTSEKQNNLKNNNNSLNICTNNNYSNLNNIDLEHKTNKNLYVMNLKRVYNFSRNKKEIINSNKNHFNQNHTNPNHKPKKTEYVDHSKKNITTNEKNPTIKIIDFIKKSHKNYVARNHLKNYSIEVFFNNETNNDSKEIIDNKSFRNFGNSKSIYSSWLINKRNNNISISNCNIGAQGIYKYRNSNLTLNKINKSKYKKKIQ